MRVDPKAIVVTVRCAVLGGLVLMLAVPVYLYLEAFRYNDFGVAAATGWVMVVASLALAIPYLWLMYRRMFAADA